MSFLDFQYFVCFYTTIVDYSGGFFKYLLTYFKFRLHFTAFIEQIIKSKFCLTHNFYEIKPKLNIC